jgi:uncharacterized membrane-anchored protein YjiN (DUF445 family)
MKAVALGLLLVAVVGYALTFLAADGEAGWVGFVRAACEAGVVGGLADWFAVTALFRRPLGLPIPHTALIPTRKDALAGSLGEFFTSNFVTAENLRAQLDQARLVPKAAGWLLVPGRAETLVRRGLAEAAAAPALLSPEAVADVLLDVVHRDTARRSYAAVGGALLADFTDSGQHTPLLDAVLPYVHRGLVEHRPSVVGVARQVVDDKAGVLGFLVSDKRLGALVDGVTEQVAAMAGDPAHPLRQALDQLLSRVADDLQHDPKLRTEVDSAVLRFLADPATRDWWVQVADGALAATQAAFADPDGPLAQALTRALTDLAVRARDEQAFQTRLAGSLEALVVHLVTEYGQEVTALVERTVKGWDGADAADKIELAAGRDLQFIRINGTVVGALAGTAIHTATVLLA